MEGSWRNTAPLTLTDIDKAIEVLFAVSYQPQSSEFEGRADHLRFLGFPVPASIKDASFVRVTMGDSSALNTMTTAGNILQ